MDGGAVISGLLQTATHDYLEEVDNFSQKTIGNDPPPAKIRN
jgi:hypothetical protein